MRELIYGVEGKSANLTTFAMDEPGQGGACHVYQIEKNDPGLAGILCTIEFQNGPIKEDGNGVNGVQHEDLLAIIIDRLKGFQSGPYRNGYNAAALEKCKEALDSLQARTRERIARGVEGTHKI